MYTAINLIGPKAQELLGELTDTPLETKNFFSMTCKVSASKSGGIIPGGRSEIGN